MNLTYNFFKFLEKKEGKKMPFKIKLIYDSKSIEGEDLYVDDDLDIAGSTVTTLPDNLTVGGYIFANRDQLKYIPDHLKRKVEVF